MRVPVGLAVVVADEYGVPGWEMGFLMWFGEIKRCTFGLGHMILCVMLGYLWRVCDMSLARRETDGWICIVLYHYDWGGHESEALELHKEGK